MVRSAAGILALVGAALVAASSFVPIYEFDDFGFKLVDFDQEPRSTLFIGLENAFVAVAATVGGVIVLASRSRVIGGFLAGIGAQTTAVYISYLGLVALDGDPASTIGGGSGLGLGGGMLILAAGIAVWMLPGPAAEPDPFEAARDEPPAGWYPDPGGAAQFRYWTGQEWSAETHD